MASIIFLGTAGTNALATKQFRASGGIVIAFEDMQFHLDPGPGALNKAREYGVNVHHTSAILVSNNNLVNCNDLNILVDAMTHSGIEHRGIILGSKTVLEGHEETSAYLTARHRSMVEKIIPLTPGHKVGIELVQVNAFKAIHTDPNATGFKLFLPKFTLGYTGDTGFSEELLENLSGSDILILNVPFPSNRAQGAALDTQAAIKIVAHVRPRLAILTHFGLEMLKADPLQEAREVQRITGVQTISAQDGLKIAGTAFGVYKSPIKGFD